MRGSVWWLSFLDGFCEPQKAFDDTIDIFMDVLVRRTKHSVTEAYEAPFALGVPALLEVGAVSRTIDFNHDVVLTTNEVSEEVANWGLASKFHPGKLAVADA